MAQVRYPAEFLASRGYAVLSADMHGDLLAHTIRLHDSAALGHGRSPGAHAFVPSASALGDLTFTLAAN